MIELNVIQPIRIANSKIKKKRGKKGKVKESCQIPDYLFCGWETLKTQLPCIKVAIPSDISVTIDLMISNIEDPMPEMILIKNLSQIYI